MSPEYCDEHKLRIETSKSNCKNIEHIEYEINEKIWPELGSRPKTTTLLAVVVIVIGILGGSFSLLYNQGQITAQKVEIQGLKMTERIDSLTETLRNDIRRIENNQMLMEGGLMKDREKKDGR